ncbi:MAG: hypothetical protein U0X73_08575 [Thermoanaerobaculia bacterium]
MRVASALAGWPGSRWARLLLVLAFAWLAAMHREREPFSQLRGDEGTFVAMTASLARDGDLAFGPADIAWARSPRAGAPVAVILERTARGISYSKPILYPLLATPFYLAVGERGMVALNLLALAIAFFFARAYLARLGERGDAEWTAATFFAASVVLAEGFWRMTEALQVALAVVGLVLAFGGRVGGRFDAWRSSRARPVAGALLLGVLASLREPNAVMAILPAAAALVAPDLPRRPERLRRAALLLAAAAVGYLAVVGATVWATGAPNPYKATRASFSGATGYPGEPDLPAPTAQQFDELPHTSMLAVEPDWQPRVSLYSALYFWVGRHTGMVFYFPAAVLLLAVALGRPDRAGALLVAGFAAIAVFYLVWMPRNYYGGETFLGNRYIAAATACLLVAIPRLPSRRALAGTWIWAAIVALSALVSARAAAATDRASQNHAYAGVFRLAPYDSTASHVEGRRDRYWSGDFLRFTDPWARADRWSFDLATGSSPAEIEIATTWPGSPLRFLVATDAPRAGLRVSSWRGTREIALAAPGGPVEIDPGPAWRFHGFWFEPAASYTTRLVRLALVAPAGAPATARLRYLGRTALPATGFGREVESLSLPAEAVAGARTAIALRLRNTGDFAWTEDAVLPVRLGWKLAPEDPAGRALEGRVPLPVSVAPGATVAAEVEIAWPAAPGRYRLRVDLVMEDVAWFAAKTGAPLAEVEVDVRAAPPSRP